ncbi:BatA domain-containing protein [Thalassotalea piscium]|uniref:Aerotolerance regulator N-terminal domain-containing protein n=1 Tax=Thalassotalea piscium TaxID=1230533 RepID=A0A7X0NH01_9GAMM|nr:BatA domain-containing protein [Thalassotalea piscium]MBB6543188.1 hypothetical protein [Thalassotalea piscium]
MTTSLFSITSLQPLAYYGLAALAIPVIIHLLSKSRGRIVKWGTTRFLPQSKPVKMSTIKLTQRLLLLLRCLIVLCSVAILSQPFINDYSGDETFVLVSETWFKAATPEQREQISEYLTSSDFNVLSLQTLESFTTFTNVTEVEPAEPLNIWQQLSKVSKKFKQAKEILVFTEANAINFTGEKPLLNQPIKWFITSQQSSQQYSLNSLVQQAFKLIIYAEDEHKEALNYLLPALNAIQKFSVQQLSIEVIEHPQKLVSAQQPNWVFYLANRPITQELISWRAQGTHIFINNDNRLLVNNSEEITVNNGFALLAPIRFYQSSHLENTFDSQHVEHQEDLWVSEDNKPLLTVFKVDEATNTNAGKRYQFASMLSPKSTNLVIQPQFPLVIQRLLFGDQINSYQKENDQVTADNINQLTALLYQQAIAHQAFLDTVSDKAYRINNTIDFDAHQDMLLWLGLLLVLLVLLERLLSEYSVSKQLVVNKNE